MKSASLTAIWTIGMVAVGGTAVAADAAPRPPQEPAGFITGGVIGGLAAGPVGAVVGAGLGAWLGNRVHRAGEAARADRQLAVQQGETQRLLAEKAALTARVDQLSHATDMAQAVQDQASHEETARVLDGLQGDVLFRTGSAEIAPEMAQSIGVLAQAVARSPALKVKMDGYADARGSDATNLKLSEQRANAVRDLFLAAGVGEDALEVNAYGKSLSVADDSDGYALERRVRLTLQSQIVQVSKNE